MEDRKKRQLGLVRKVRLFKKQTKKGNTIIRRKINI